MTPWFSPAISTCSNSRPFDAVHRRQPHAGADVVGRVSFQDEIGDAGATQHRHVQVANLALRARYDADALRFGGFTEERTHFVQQEKSCSCGPAWQRLRTVGGGPLINEQ
jgi:hypothetical protein